MTSEPSNPCLELEEITCPPVDSDGTGEVRASETESDDRSKLDWIAGRYRVDRLIADGGMGRVFQATHVALGQKVAIKFLREELSQRSDLVARFLQEARAFARLRGQHVLRILDVGASPSGTPFMVLEYLEGCDLYTVVVETAPIDQKLAVDWLLQALEGLAEVHGLGIVHRDIKPENLFLAEQTDGRAIVKILDFGISKDPIVRSARSLTNAATPIGSPHYMAPEQMQRPHEVDARADIWSVGVVLYELLTGKNPFEAGNFADVYARVLFDVPVLPHQHNRAIKTTLSNVIMKALDKDPEARFADVAEFAAALAPFGSRQAAACARRVSRILNCTRLGTTSKKTSQPSAVRLVERETRVRSIAGELGSDRPFWRRGAVAGVAACAGIGAALLYGAPEPAHWGSVNVATHRVLDALEGRTSATPHSASEPAAPKREDGASGLVCTETLAPHTRAAPAGARQAREQARMSRCAAIPSAPEVRTGSQASDCKARFVR